MADFENLAGPGWAARLEPNEATRDRLRHAGPEATRLVECGHKWDAVVITPLARGLTALDVLGLPLDEGYLVIADYSRGELIIPVPTGVDFPNVPGVRLLTRGSWLLVPVGSLGSFGAAWLSAPTSPEARYVDPAALREVLMTADEKRGEHARIG